MKSFLYAYLIAVLIVTGCSSGKTTFERGNYYEAVITAVNRLRRNSDHKKSAETLRQAYPMAVTSYEDEAKTSLASADRFKWSAVVKCYTAINTMYDEIRRCPGALAVVPEPINYFNRLQQAKQNAAEENYAAGILALQPGTRESAKQAYAYFKIANEYVAGYKEVNAYLEAALSAATVKIVVEPVPVHSISVGVSAEFFNDKISEFIHSAAISQFVKFYTRAEAQKTKLNPDHIIQLEFDDFSVGEIHRQEKEIVLSKDSVLLATYVNGASSHQSADQNGDPNTRRTGNAFVMTGKNQISTVEDPTKTRNDPGSNPKSETDKQDLAEKQLREEQQRQRELEEKMRLEREAAERQRVAKEAAEREAAALAAAEKQRAADAAAQAERAAKEAADRALAEKLAAEKQQAENDRLERERAEKERLDRERAEKEELDRETAERVRAEKEKAEREKAEKERADLAAKAEAELAAKEASDRAKEANEKAEKEKADREKAEKEKAENDRIEKEKADKERAEKEKAEKERAEKEKSEKERAAEQNYFDPSIKSEDTLNVNDPVVVCHIPPGNAANARTLRINRAALKAHLAHGDVEGGCNKDDDGQQNQPNGNGGNPDAKPGGVQQDPKAKPQDDKKVKGDKGTGKADKQDERYFHPPVSAPVLLASRETDPADIFRYLPAFFEADTNKVYGTVKATFYHYIKTTTSRGIVSFKILDAKTGALLSIEKMPGEFVWKSEWATFNGDERALSPEQLKLTQQKELPAPEPQELFIEFTRPIYDQITTKLKEFYRGY